MRNDMLSTVGIWLGVVMTVGVVVFLLGVIVGSWSDAWFGVVSAVAGMVVAQQAVER